jgi:hypothetical protein
MGIQRLEFVDDCAGSCGCAIEVDEDGHLVDYSAHLAAVDGLVKALELARPVLDEELQSLCDSYCPPCKEGETYDYSELQEPELGWIKETETALDAVDAAIAASR